MTQSTKGPNIHIVPEYFNLKHLGVVSLTDLGIFADGKYAAR